MLISALCDYYDMLAKQGKVIPETRSEVDLSYLISLTPDGKVNDIINCCITETVEKKGKMTEISRPRPSILPRRSEKPAIFANLVEFRPSYIFGLNYDGKTGSFFAGDEKDKARKSHDAFAEKIKESFKDIDSPIAQAYLHFAESWEPEKESNNPLLLNLGKNFNKSFGFCLSGHPEILLHEDEATLAAFDRAYALSGNDDAPKGICAITGEELPIARIHDKISGVSGGNSTGTTLISFKNPSESSYGKDQSYNSNISEQAMKKYTAALNYLLDKRNHRTTLDDVTIVHWASSAADEADDLFNDLLGISNTLDAEHMDLLLKSLATGLSSGIISVDLDGVERLIDPDVSFYMVGLKPNSARLSVKFIYRQQFGKLVQNILMHQKDMKISETSRPVPLWAIRRELISPKSSKNLLDPSAMTKILEAVLYGKPYPDFLLSTIVRRVRTDSDDENNSYIKMNDTRMGILKACINRDDRKNHKEEEIKMALDLENKNPAYLCGRLFAELEIIQQKASNNSLNRTIKDAYFSAASTRPATIFPKLLKLSQHHMAKLDAKGYWEKQVRDIIDSLDGSFPDTLSLKDQGVFMIGYYQQNGYRPSKSDN